MRYQIISVFTIAILLIGSFPTPSASASSTTGATYYVDANHPQAQDSNGHGSINQPWKTLQYAFQQLQPGDTLLIRSGTYENRAIELTGQNSGQESAPITVKPYPGETVILRNGKAINLYGANWWTIEGLIFDEPKGQYIHLGLHEALGHSKTVAAEHITIRNCEFKNGTRVIIRISFANDVLIENNHFHHVRPGMPFHDSDGRKIGWEMNAVDIEYIGNNIVVSNNRFEEIGSDGVQLGAQAYRAGSSIGSVSIVNNEFWVNRPYEGILGNVGENGIDIKKAKGPILISCNTIHGFRPTTPQQDASGSNGEGIVIHNNAKNIVVERNFFYDNTFHLDISQGAAGTPGGTRDIIVRNNIFREAQSCNQKGGYALKVGSAANIEVYHNTFYNNEIYLRSWDASGSFNNNVIVNGRPGVSRDSAWEADYNAWSQVEGNVPQTLQGNHDLRVDNPYLGHNLQPMPDSPLINAGQNLMVPNDFDGYHRTDGLPDLGAFEYKDEFRAFLPFVGRYASAHNLPPRPSQITQIHTPYQTK